MDWADKRVVVTGGAGFLGRAVCRKLHERGCQAVHVPRRKDYDLTTEASVVEMYDHFRPNVVLHLAAEVGRDRRESGAPRPLLLREPGHGPPPDRTSPHS